MGNGEKPRLCVFRSNRYIYAQIIDDIRRRILCGYSSLNDKNIKKMKKREAASEVGRQIAKIAIEKGIKQVTFDRGGYKYHGQVKALAEGARQAGLKF